MRILKAKSVACYVIVAVLMAVTVAMPRLASADVVLDVYPTGTQTKNPVADNITRLNVDKLEKGARDQVLGAHLAILEKETGNLVVDWWTDGKTKEISRNADDPNSGALDIDKVYILRELEAPAGYQKAADVEFIIHSDNFNTTGEILSGGDNGNAESAAIRGSGPEQAFVISLFDEATIEVTDEERRTRQREIQDEIERGGSIEKTSRSQVEQEQPNATTQTTQSQSSGTQRQIATTTVKTENLTKTGDYTNYVPIIVIAVIGVGIIAFAIYKRRQ